MTPDNAGYYHVAYVLAVAVYVAYAASLWARRRALRRRASLARTAG